MLHTEARLPNGSDVDCLRHDGSYGGWAVYAEANSVDATPTDRSTLTIGVFAGLNHEEDEYHQLKFQGDIQLMARLLIEVLAPHAATKG